MHGYAGATHGCVAPAPCCPASHPWLLLLPSRCATMTRNPRLSPLAASLPCSRRALRIPASRSASAWNALRRCALFLASCVSRLLCSILCNMVMPIAVPFRRLLPHNVVAVATRAAICPVAPAVLRSVSAGTNARGEAHRCASPLLCCPSPAAVTLPPLPPSPPAAPSPTRCRTSPSPP